MAWDGNAGDKLLWDIENGVDEAQGARKRCLRIPKNLMLVRWWRRADLGGAFLAEGLESVSFRLTCGFVMLKMHSE